MSLSHNRLLLALAVVLSFTACTDDRETAGTVTGSGSVSINLTPDFSVKETIESRADDSESAEEAPDPLQALKALGINDLKITMTSADGSFSQTWDSIGAFPEEEQFPVGLYTMTASHGSLEEEGFEKPHVYGEAQFRILEDQTTGIELVSTVQHSAVGINYTGRFKRYFSAYSVAVNSAAGNPHIFDPDETRAVYIAPGETKIEADLTLPSGKTGTVEVATVETRAATHHNITLDVNVSSEDVLLVVSFDDTLEREDVNIDLAADSVLQDAPLPVVSPMGFEGSVPVTFYEGNSVSADASYRFGIIARGKMDKVNLTVKTADNKTTVYDLLNEQVQKNLIDAKLISARGVKRGEKFGLLDLSGWVSSLSLKNRNNTSGETTLFTLEVADSLQQATDPDLAADNTLNVLLGPESSVLSNPNDIVPGGVFNLILDTTIDDLVENPSRLSVRTDNMMGGHEYLDYTVKRNGTRANGYPYQYTLTLPTPAYKLTFDVDGQHKHSGTFTNKLTITRELPALIAGISENDIFRNGATLRIKLKEEGEEELFCSILKQEGVLKVKVAPSKSSNDAEEQNIIITAENYDNQTHEIAVDIKDLEAGKHYTVTLYYDGNEYYTQPIKPKVVVPEINCNIDEVDVYAKYATAYITLKDDSQREQFKDLISNEDLSVELTPKIGTLPADLNAIEFDDQGRFPIKMTHLASGTAYTLTINYLDAESEGENTVAYTLTFTTETEYQIPGASFDTEFWSSINIGQYQTMWNLTGDASIWKTNNSTTMNGAGGTGENGAAYKFTSGTKYDGGAALIRTVGYGSGNSYQKGAIIGSGTAEKCESLAPGELYLDSKDSENGIELGARPNSVSFKYKYTPKNSDDKGYYKIVVKGTDGTEALLVTGNLESKGNYMEKKEDVDLNALTSKTAYIYIYFSSTYDPETFAKTYSQSYASYPSVGGWSNANSTTYQTEFVGSQLWIDDLELIYNEE